MKKYVKAASTIKLKQIPAEDDLLDILNFTVIDYDAYLSAALRGKDLVVDTGDDYLTIYKNGADYTDELLLDDMDFDTYTDFMKAHPEIKVETTYDIYDILN